MRCSARQTARRLLVFGTLLMAATVSVPTAGHPETYPSRDITFIVPYAPGGSTDPLARQFTTQLQKILGGNIVVENKPGGSATIGTHIVVRAKPNGYTIGLTGNSTLAYQPLVTTGLEAFDSPDDYQPIVKMTDQIVILTVNADAPWKTFAEFMADARKNPGKIRVSVSAVGGLPDLSVKQLNKVAGVKLTTVPLSGGGGEATVALLGKRVEANAGFGTYMLGYSQAGKVRVLAVFKKGKYDLFPEAIPVVDAGYNAAVLCAYYAIAPKGLPKDVKDRLVSASLQVVNSEEYSAWAKKYGLVVDPKGPEEVKEEINQYRKDFSALVKFLGQK